MNAFRAALFLALIGALAAGCQRSQPRKATGKVEVVASIFPLADVVSQVGGECVHVTCLLRPGESPHNFTPRAEQAEQIARARLVVMVGLGIDEWAARAGAFAAGRDATVVKLAEDPAFKKIFHALEDQDRHEEEATRPAGGSQPAEQARAANEHEHPGADPHVWLDPVYMQQFTLQIAEALSAADPANAAQYRRRCQAYIEQLKALDEEYRKTLSAVKHKQFVTFHAAFGYIAARYGLRQEALASADAAGLGPAQLEKVARFVQENHVQAIFAEPQFPPEKLQVIAKRSGAKVGQLDPEGNPFVKGYDSYLAMMRSNLRALAEALK